MIEPNTLELIQQEIDGENSAELSAQLQARVQADPRARELRDEFGLLAGELDSLTSVDPPAGLAAAVLERIRRTRAFAIHPSAGELRKPARAGRRNLASLVYAAAAGLVIGLLLSPLLFERRPELGSFDWIAATGSMARPTHPLDRKEISTGAIEGSATLRAAGDGIALELDLHANEPANLHVRFDPSLLAFEAIRRAPEGVGPLAVTPGEVRMDVSGSERATVLLRRLVPHRAEVVLAMRTERDATEITLSTEGGPQ